MLMDRIFWLGQAKPVLCDGIHPVWAFEALHPERRGPTYRAGTRIRRPTGRLPRIPSLRSRSMPPRLEAREHNDRREPLP